MSKKAKKAKKPKATKAKAPAVKAKAKKKAAPKKAAAAAVAESDGKVLMNIKVARAEKKAAVKLAEKHAGGNFSRWMRRAMLNFKPTKEDLKAMAPKKEDPFAA